MVGHMGGAKSFYHDRRLPCHQISTPQAQPSQKSFFAIGMLQDGFAVTAIWGATVMNRFGLIDLPNFSLNRRLGSSLPRIVPNLQCRSHQLAVKFRNLPIPSGTARALCTYPRASEVSFCTECRLNR